MSNASAGTGATVDKFLAAEVASLDDEDRASKSEADGRQGAIGNYAALTSAKRKGHIG
ncbi:hypothetical protein AB0L00_29520 [Actinoallomurus sp. NPDC052308]|uniref:hypothetical protein n=1 Tax=Actinoallomurus sp. NPDC052308 TaxID=3155530 RepID=UPI00344A6874